MKKIVFALLTLSMFSCHKDTSTLYLKGNVEGLRRGKIYLQRMENNKLITLDSVTARGNGRFSFQQQLEYPEVLYLQLEKEDGNPYNDRLEFFAVPGEMEIDTQVNLFDVNAKIEGSLPQKEWEAYNKVMKKINYEGLDLLQQQINAARQGNVSVSDSIQKLVDKNTLRRYLYTINYALNHKESFVTPYVTLRDAYNANVKYLDSIYNLLSDEVSASKYGKELEAYIKELKQEGNQSTQNKSEQIPSR